MDVEISTYAAMLQERTQTTEAQLAETTSQLHNLRLRQRELEARNSLLEKIAALNKQQTLPGSVQLSGDTTVNNLTNIQVNQACKGTEPT